MRARQQGAVGALLVLVLALALAVMLAIWLLNRQSDISAERESTTNALEKAAAALDAYAGSSLRLPCPADPALDDGVEVRVAAAATCGKPEGTLPWKTLGLRRDDAFDAWGRKIAYRVYTGNAGSLTQDSGASMANCDTNEAFPGGATAAGGGLGGLCKPVPVDDNPASRATTPSQFMAAKGLDVTWFGKVLDPDNDHVAYVLVSHGPTGLGGYTTSGAQLPMPVGDERTNLNATGRFTAKAFSGPDVGATTANHFDDLLLYRTIGDLATRASMAARNWPDDVTAAVTFDRNTVRDALGSNPGSDTGQSTIAFNNVTVSALDSSGNARNISFNSGSTEGIGAVGGAGDQLESAANGAEEVLRLDFAEPARQFSFALDDFGYDTVTIFGTPVPYRWEQVELRFFDAAVNLLATATKTACRKDPNVATYTVDAGADFTRVEMRPLPTPSFTSARASEFFVIEVRACKTGVSCQTTTETADSTTACP